MNPKTQYEICLTVNSNNEPVFAYSINDRAIYDPTMSDCSRFEVDPYEAYGLTPEQVEALHQLNVAHGYNDSI